MRKFPDYKDFDIEPLDGLFDVRTPAGSMPIYDFRLVLNMEVTEQRKRRRMGGWKKFGSDSEFGFKNQDLHDQLLNCQFYYETNSWSVFVDGTITGYQYPFFWPDTVTQVTYTEDPVGGPYHGYANDFYDDLVPFANVGSEFIASAFTGYPYVEDGPWYTDWNTGYPDYWRESEYTTGFWHAVAPTTIPGYGYGTPTDVFTNPYNYTYQTCGTDLYTHPGCREAVTLLFEAMSYSGRRKLIAATKDRIYALNARSGNWRILADGLGGPYQPGDCACSDRKFKAAQLGNVVLFTNNYDPVLFWQLDEGPGGCDFWSADYVTDLVDLNITQAKVIVEWKGFMFLCNVEVDNERHANRIYWSDFNNPHSWAPGGESLANFTDLGAGHRIMAAAVLGSQLRLYTSKGETKSIWDVTLVGGNDTFQFDEIYSGPDGIEFPNSLVNLGKSHVYLSSAGIMVLGEYDRVPQRYEWTYKADGVIYSGIRAEWVKSFAGLAAFGGVNDEACENVIGGYDSLRKHIWFSWPTDTNVCPNMSLVLNPVYKAASLVDAGFTAFCMARPDYSASLRDWLVENAGCDPASMLEAKEGEPYDLTAGDDPPAYIRNETEDPDLPSHADSLCARVAGTSLEDICEQCDSSALFLMASAADRTIKEFCPDEYYRERYVDSGATLACPYTVEGTYVDDGYYSLLQSDSLGFKHNAEKLLNKGKVEYVAEAQTTPSNLNFEVAYGPQAACMRWDTTADPVAMECLTDKTDSEHETDNTRADTIARYNFYRRGRYLAYRFYTSGTGGACSFEKATVSVRPVQGDW